MTQTSTTSSAFLLSHISGKQEPVSLPVRSRGFKYKSARRVTRFSPRRNTVKRKVLRAVRSTHLQRRLTPRSTGPIAACRHLGYESLAQIPARRNGPVNSNVRPHPKTACNILAFPINSCGAENNTTPTGRTLARKCLHAARSILFKPNVPSFNILAGRCLTLRSTGPIAACRHLGYKSLAQIPAHRNGPVN